MLYFNFIASDYKVIDIHCDNEPEEIVDKITQQNE